MKNNLKKQQATLLPPIDRRQTQPIQFDQINQLINQSLFIPKQNRAQSLYSLESQAQDSGKQYTKISPRKNIKDYNKWYVPPKKRFLDLRKESQEFQQEQYIINTYAQQQMKYNQILKESKQLAQFVEEFYKKHKRSPSFIH
ncbi:unnamed protein product (macronuclear) [Paramecium tetraurelia]|uniref:Uncharacterized protein n=1 Tax=Paramecium tetraurelia TaxID=5888 RepID=A0DJ44_PARTE|nr:uncharacterized protein GSPATT00017418001 [Paramecium tetraurelia]CAK83061.1 unnamed protein product [Paramecium tetraurelia]|eukprot:XP_001450458.1 hypothetical protein (macronuclear) [Paramecium tetraurelia strain d4-2]